MTTIEIAEAVPTPKKIAAVIDDAFDDVLEGEIKLAPFKAFYESIDDTGELAALLVKLNINPPNIQDWDDESDEFLDFLNGLWKLKEDPSIKELLERSQLFVKKLEKLKDLTKLCEILKKHAIDVKEFDSTNLNPEDFRDDKFNYIFIDYNLGVKEGDDAITRAQNVIKEIYKVSSELKRPVTILMSSNPNINGLAERFREESGLIEGVFRSAPKADLLNENRLSLLAKSYDEAFIANHVLQLYIQTLTDAAKNAHEEFVREIKTLNIEDYEFILNSVLKEEQQPLGDYLSWLYGTYWTNLLYKKTELTQQQKKLDKIIGDKSPMHSKMPSSKLADIFMGALFEEGLHPLTKHPLHGIEEKITNQLYLHLGDVFTTPKSPKVYMVLNPQCDLERPKLVSKENSILLLPGTLQLLAEPIEKKVKTDFFIFEEERYRIYWDLKKVITVQFKAMPTWIKSGRYQRNFRLRLPYALDLQQQFVSNMSRVGIPVSPPIAQNIEITVKCKLFENKPVVFLAKSDQYAFFAITREKVDKKIRLTLDFAMAFKDAIIEKLASTQKRIAEQGEGAKPKNFDVLMAQITTFVEDIDKWFFANRGFANPSADITKVRDKLLSATYEADEAKISTPFWIVIHPKKLIEQSIQTTPKPEIKKKGVLNETAKTRAAKVSRRQKKAIKVATRKQTKKSDER